MIEDDETQRKIQEEIQTWRAFKYAAEQCARLRFPKAQLLGHTENVYNAWGQFKGLTDEDKGK